MIFLDPPYDNAEHCVNYNGGGAVWADVCAWAIEAGKREDMAVVLCGYDGTFSPPGRWDALAWKAAGGYGSQGNKRGRDNCKREVVWFSPGAYASGLFG